MRVATLAVGLVVSGALALQAQDSVRIGGVIRDPAGQPIPDVGVMLMPGERHARTDANGQFSFRVLPADYYLSFRRLGFYPRNQLVRASRDTTLQLALDRRPQMLDTIVVADECSRLQFSGFLCRRAKGQGVFLTEADILAKNPKFLADIFLGMKDFHVEPTAGPYGPQRYVRATQSRCLVQLYNGREGAVRDQAIDGTSQTSGASGRTLTEGDYYGPQTLIGVEIYPPGYPTPEEYQFRARGVARGGGRIAGSGNAPKGRRVQPMTEKCVLVNYWTTAALPKPKKKS